MRLLKLYASRRRQRRYAVVALATAVVVVAFGASFVAAQESRNFMPWFIQANGGGTTGDSNTIMRTSLGQLAVGRTTSDDFEITLGFDTGVQAGASAFAARVRELALTPRPTSTATFPPTATSEPTKAPTDATATAETVAHTPTPETPSADDTSTPVPGERPTSTAVPATRTPVSAGPPTEIPTNTPVVIVVTSVPEPAPETVPEATATPYIIVVTAPPADTPTPEPPSGGACGLPVNNGLDSLDLGMLMLLLAPLMMIWKIGFKR